MPTDGFLAEHYCQFDITDGSVAASSEFDDDCCGKVARFRLKYESECGIEVWLCAEHWDAWQAAIEEDEECELDCFGEENDEIGED